MKYDVVSVMIPKGSFKGLTIHWCIRDVGIGQFAFYTKKNDIYIDNEYMDKNVIKAVLCKLVDEAVLVNKAGDKRKE